MTYKNMQIGDVVQQGEHDEDPYVIKDFTTDEQGGDAIMLHRVLSGTEQMWRIRDAGGGINQQLHPWAGALDLDIAAGDDLTPEWSVYQINAGECRMVLQYRQSQEPTEWMDMRLGRLAERVWLISNVTEWQSVYNRKMLREGAVVKRRTKAVADYYPYGVVVKPGEAKGLWTECRVMFGNETFPCLAGELDVVASSMTVFSAQLRKEGEYHEQRLRERDEELESYKRTVAEVLAANAAENNWEGVQDVYTALEVDPPNPRVEFDLTVTVRVLATRTGGDPGDELKKSFLANSFSTGIVHNDPGEGFGVWADADLKDVEVVAGSTRIKVENIEKEQ